MFLDKRIDVAHTLFFQDFISFEIQMSLNSINILTNQQDF